MNTLSDSASPLYEKVKDFVLGNIGSGKGRATAGFPRRTNSFRHSVSRA